MSLVLVPRQTALVLIDLEHGIVARDLAPHKGTDIVKTCATLADSVRTAGGTVVYVHVLLHQLLRLPADRPMTPPNAPVPPPAASELVPDSGYNDTTDILITKRQWGAFHATSLDQQLRRKGINTVILAGIATNFGVESTARAAVEHGYNVLFAEDAMTSFSADLHNFAIKNTFPIIGRVLPADDIAAALKP